MTTTRCTASLLALAVAFASSACIGGGNTVNVYGGKSFLDADDWDDLDNPTVYGADVALKLNLPWLSVEGGYLRTEEDDDSVGELYIDEYFAGLRLTPWKIFVEPYLSAGISYVYPELEMAGDYDDEVWGYYGRLGFALTFAIVRFGVEGRALFGSDVDLGTLETDVDTYQLLGFVGLSF